MTVKKSERKRAAHDRDGRGRFNGATPGPGRPVGSTNKTPIRLRESFAAVFAQAGGEAMLLRVARKFPRDFLALLVKLEPRILKADLDVDMNVSAAPRVLVTVPFNFRCDPSLLAGQLVREPKNKAKAKT